MKFAWVGLIFSIVCQPAWPVDFDFGGEATVEPHVYFQTLPRPTRQQDQILRLVPRASFKSGKLRGQTKFSLRSNNSSKVPVEKFFANVQEAFLEYKAYPFKGRFGINTYNWGYMDGFSPLDVVNTKVFLDPLASEKRGSPVVDLLFESDTWSFQGLYVPIQQSPVMPATDSRWLPREVLIDTSVQASTLELPDEFNYQYRTEKELDSSLHNNFGFRFQKRFASADVGLVYFEGVSPAPQFEIEATGSLSATKPNTVVIDSDVLLTPLFHRQRISGLQLAYQISDLIVKLESSYTESITESSEIPSWTYQNALGVEVPFYIGSKTLTLLVQGYYGNSDIGKDNLVSSGTRIFDESSALGFRYGLSSSTSILATGVYDFSTDSYFTHAELSTGFGKYTFLRLTHDYFAGDEDTLLGSFNRNERFRFILTVKY